MAEADVASKAAALYEAGMWHALHCTALHPLPSYTHEKVDKSLERSNTCKFAVAQFLL